MESYNISLTKNLKLYEYAVSADFPELAAQIAFSGADTVKAFYMSILNVQPVRDRFGLVITLSGKRTPELNINIGGAECSDHLWQGVSCAVDFTCPKADMNKVWFWMQRDNGLMSSDRESFGQLIYYPNQNFIHVSLPTLKHHGEVFVK